MRDIIKVDEQLLEKINTGAFQNDRFSHEDSVETGINELFYEMLKKYIDGNNTEDIWYLNEDSLVFIVGLSRSMGYYIEFEIPYTELEWLDGS